jgi:hypothetical protein
VQELAGYLATVETYTSIQEFHSSRFDQELRGQIAKSISPAFLEIRDAVFQQLIRISPASKYMEELVTGPGGLLSRGLLENHAASYGALPRTKQDRATLPGILNDYVRVHFPNTRNLIREQEL